MGLLLKHCLNLQSAQTVCSSHPEKNSKLSFSFSNYILYLLDQKRWLLFFSSCSRGRLQFESGCYSKAVFINDLTHVLLIYDHVMMSCELDMIKTITG